MTKLIFDFQREGKSVAELHLELRPDSSVSDWSWHGDPAVKKAMKRLPYNRHSLEDAWHMGVITGSEREGLTFTMRMEGDPLPLPG